MITEERAVKFKEVISKRQNDLTVILEKVHDPHNIGAVLRTCDSVGVAEIYVIAPEKYSNLSEYLGKSTTSKGAGKWIKIHFFKNSEACLNAVLKNGYSIYGTHLNEEATSLYNLDLGGKVALLFGNEHDGISVDSLSYLRGNFYIPQVGLVQSLNISVACAVSLYEAFRQRLIQGRYANKFNSENERHSALFQEFVSIHRKLKSKRK